MTTMCDFNDYIIYQNKDKNVAGISIGLKIFSLIMYLIGCLGIFTIFGIIHFEKYGQDCQKRSFPDQILSFNCKMFMIIMPIYWGISQIRWIFWTYRVYHDCIQILFVKFAFVFSTWNY